MAEYRWMVLLTALFESQSLVRINDRDFSDEDDDLYHSTEAEIPNQVVSGSLFEQFPFIGQTWI